MKLIQVQDLFEVYKGKSYFKDFIEDKKGLNYITTSEKNQGVKTKVHQNSNYKIFPKNTITVALQGSVMSSFVQQEDFYLQTHVAALIEKRPLTIRQKLYYCLCFSANSNRFSFGRKANTTFSTLEIPAPEEIPSWVETIELPQQMTGKAKSNEKVELPPVSEWKVFKYTDLFKLEKARGPKISEVKNITGSTAYISATSENNGVKCFCNVKPEHEGKRITCGHLGDCFYQEAPFIGSNIVIMNPKFPINRQIGLFIITILNQNKFLFSYAGGGVAGLSKLSKMSLSLPVTSEGQPDYDLMERYINSLPYSANL